MSARRAIVAIALAAALALAGCGATVAPPTTTKAAKVTARCSDHPDQASAQRAADTRDPNHDGVFCDRLPCPCLRPGATRTTPAAAPSSCVRPKGVQPISFSATRFPRIREHTLEAIRSGWPAILVLNRAGSGARRAQLLENVPTRPGLDRDEYPPAVGRGRGEDLTRGLRPVGWRADVAYVPSGENRSHGSILGIKLRRFCDGTRFRYVFY